MVFATIPISMGLLDESSLRQQAVAAGAIPQIAEYQAADTFRSLPVLEQLVLASRSKVRGERFNNSIVNHEARRYTLQSLFALEPEQWETLGIQMYALAFRDGEGLEIRYGNAENYQIFFAFPYDDGSVGSFKTTRSKLGFALAEGNSVDVAQATTIADQVTLDRAELIEPLDLDIYALLVRSIKNIDGAIKPLHQAFTDQRDFRQNLTSRNRTPDNSELHRWHETKHRALLEYLDIAEKLETRYPHLIPLCRTMTDPVNGDGNHISLEMILPEFNSSLLTQALYDGGELPDELQLFSFEGGSQSTNINLTIKKLSSDRDYTELCDRLRARQVWQARQDFEK